MLRFVCGLVLIASATAFYAPALRSVFGTTCNVGVDCFVDKPKTVTEAEKMGWVQPEETVSNTLFSTHCPKDNGRICTLHDKSGTIAGYQISLPVSAVLSAPQPGIDYVEKGFKETVLFGEKFYSNQIYFVDEETLKTGRDFDGTIGTGLWLQVGKDLIPVPSSEKEMPGTTGFIRQNCMMRMGQHYFWNSTKDMQPDGFMPWFTLHNLDGDLHGFGFISFGSNFDDKSSTSFENPPAAAIKAIAPGSPDWIFDYLVKYGIFSHHVYFGDEPWNIPCAQLKVPSSLVETPEVRTPEVTEPEVATPEVTGEKPGVFQRFKNFFQNLIEKIHN